MAFLRPELALTQRLAGERLEAVFQAAISLSVDRFRFTADLRVIDVERRKLEQHLTPQARDALARDRTLDRRRRLGLFAVGSLRADEPRQARGHRA